jgi:hypothetical protein
VRARQWEARRFHQACCQRILADRIKGRRVSAFLGDDLLVESHRAGINDVDDLDRAIGHVRHEHASARLIDVAVVEASARVSRQDNVPLERKRHIFLVEVRLIQVGAELGKEGLVDESTPFERGLVVQTRPPNASTDQI